MDAPLPAAVEPLGAAAGLGEPDPRAVAAERLTFFVDAVVAIAITLLALDLGVPEGDTNHDLLNSMYANRETYIGFLISFYVIGTHWANHHKIARYVTRLGGRLTLVTMLWLFTLVVTPFATRVLSGGDGGFQVRFILYAAVQALSGFFYLLVVRQIQVHRLYRPDTPPDIFGNAYFGSGALAVGFLVSIPVAFHTTYAYDCWIAFPIAIALARHLYQRRAKSRAKTAVPSQVPPVE